LRFQFWQAGGDGAQVASMGLLLHAGGQRTQRPATDGRCGSFDGVGLAPDSRSRIGGEIALQRADALGNVVHETFGQEVPQTAITIQARQEIHLVKDG